MKNSPPQAGQLSRSHSRSRRRFLVQLGWGTAGLVLASCGQSVQPERPALTSEHNVDYSNLDNLLAQKSWQAADQATVQAMAAALDKSSNDWTSEDFQQFPCADLQTIDGLWQYHSRGKFGLTAQKEIYLRNCRDCGGVLDGTLHKDAWTAFLSEVGWMEERGIGSKYLDYDSLVFNLNQAPSGHLPALALNTDPTKWDIRCGTSIRCDRWLQVLWARLTNCQLT